MNLSEITAKIFSLHLPTYVLAGAGILVTLLAFKLVKGLFKLLFVLAALALLGAAVWWHFHHQ